MFQHRYIKHLLLCALLVVGGLSLILYQFNSHKAELREKWSKIWQDDELHRENLLVAEIEIGDKNVIDFSTDITFHSMSTVWMTIAFDPAIEEEIRKGWGHDAESVRLLTSMSQEANAFERLNKAIGELIKLDLDKAMEILKRYRITYHPDSKTQIGYLSNDQ